jgi:uncharacterized membrane protein YeiH
VSWRDRDEHTALCVVLCLFKQAVIYIGLLVKTAILLFSICGKAKAARKIYDWFTTLFVAIIPNPLKKTVIIEMI